LEPLLSRPAAPRFLDVLYRFRAQKRTGRSGGGIDQAQIFVNALARNEVWRDFGLRLENRMRFELKKLGKPATLPRQ